MALRSVLYNAVLSAKSMKPSKLNWYLEMRHSNRVGMDLEVFKPNKSSLKGQSLNFTASFQQEMLYG